MPYCPECGAEVADDQTYCRDCGARLYDDESTEPREPGDTGVDASTATEPEKPVDESSSAEDYDDEGLVSYAISFPGRSGFGPVLVGGILFLLSILILPFFIVAGYLVKLTEYAAKGRPEPPEDFGDWSDLLVYGLVVSFLVYLPLLVLIYAAFLVPTLLLADSVPAVGLLLGAVLALLVGYLFPAVLVNYCVNQRLGDAYDPGRISDLAFNSTYLLSYLIFFFLNILLSLFFFVAILLSFLTLIGWIIIIPLIYFYQYAIFAAYWGRVYYKTVGAGA